MSLSTRASAGAFSPVTIIVAVLVSVVALAGMGVLSAYRPELQSGNDGGSHPLSRASIGYGALPRLMRSLGVPVVLSRGDLSAGSEDSLLVLTPSVETDPDRIEDIRHIGPTLIVLPKWVAVAEPGHPGWVSTAGVLPLPAVLQALPEELRDQTRLTAREGAGRVALRRPSGLAFGAPVEVEGLRTLSGAAWIPVVVDEQGGIVLGMHRDARTYLLADPDLINTQGLKTLGGAQTAVAILDIVRAGDAPVVFDLTLHGFQRTRNLLRLMLEPPLLGMTLILVALAALAGFQAAVRFGPARAHSRVIALGKRGLADNTAGLIRLARREHHMATPYALIVRGMVARAIGAPRGLSDTALDDFLDRVSRVSGAQDTYSALAERAAAARTPGDLIQVAGALYRWNQELTRARQ